MDRTQLEKILSERLQHLTNEEVLAIYASLPKTVSLTWAVQIMYKHRGRGAVCENLSSVIAESHETAIKQARSQGAKFVECANNNVQPPYITHWEVKVRPEEA